MENNMKPINFMIPEELHDKIKRAAALAEYNPSMSAWIRTVLTKEADKQIKGSKWLRTTNNEPNEHTD